MLTDANRCHIFFVFSAAAEDERPGSDSRPQTELERAAKRKRLLPGQEKPEIRRDTQIKSRGLSLKID